LIFLEALAVGLRVVGFVLGFVLGFVVGLAVVGILVLGPVLVGSLFVVCSLGMGSLLGI
jgi:hypothetical protein